MDLFLIFFCSIAIIFFLMLFYKISKSNSGKERMESNLRTQKDENGKTDFVRCPLCSTPLAKNEDMFSRIYRPMTTADQRMTVHGCPHCYPRPEPGVKRSCPVCGKEVPLDGELIARLFNRTEGKKHVMITGCSVCYRKS
ncbi:hypothetical protein [Treponema sp.]|uniref:hypothetical protein n=1 Tax=Treponema sp. TaxID=166 RepID=UPI0025CF32D3|nr:hypothetical protein [Treponema sp.]MBR4321853.1 hypothetical protein [Treponema sp.]